MVSFLEIDENDPVDAARTAGEAITAARREAEARGIKGFLFGASSEEEFDERAAVREVSEVLDGIADSYLGSRADGRSKLTSVLKREFTARAAPAAPPKLASPCGDCPSGTKCVCTHDGCTCERVAKTASFMGPDHAPDDLSHSREEVSPPQVGQDTWNLFAHLWDNHPTDEFDPEAKPEDPFDWKTEDLAAIHDREHGKTATKVVADCPTCHAPVYTEDMDEVGQREAAISGLCASCQDDYFGKTAAEDSDDDDCGSCGADLGPSDSHPWHYPDEDCRAIRQPVKNASNQSGGSFAKTANDPNCDNCGGNPLLEIEDCDDCHCEPGQETHGEDEYCDVPCYTNCDYCDPDAKSYDKAMNFAWPDGKQGHKTAAIEEFPVATETTEEESTEPRLPDWITAAFELEMQGE